MGFGGDVVPNGSERFSIQPRRGETTVWNYLLELLIFVGIIDVC